MVNIAIVEDDETEREKLKNYLADYAKEIHSRFQIASFQNAEAFLSSFQKNYDIIFMDIEMPGKNGMEASFEIRKLDSDVILIFVTNMAQFAVKGYQVDALDFIVKPVVYQDFCFRMQKAIRRVIDKDDRFISISLTGGGFIKLSIDQIRYVEIMSHDIVYHTLDGDYSSYGTLKEVEKKLQNFHFSRCNSCFLVNLKFVDSVKQYDVFLGDTVLKISQPRKKKFLMDLNEYIGG